MLIRPVPSIVSPPTPIGVGGFRGADSLILDFYSGVLDPRINYTGGANRTYIDSLGVLQDSSTNVARFDHLLSTTAALGLSVWTGRENGIRNNTMVGASAGTPGISPTNWATFSNGTTQEIVDVGAGNGIAFITYKFSGTPSADPEVRFEATTEIDALTTETRTTSAYVAIIAGDFTNISNIRFIQKERTEAGGFVKDNFGSDFKGSLTSTLQRFDYTVTLSGGGTVAHVIPALQFDWDGSGDIDLTLRIGLPQEEQGTGASPVIKTTNAAVAATADVPTMSDLTWFNPAKGTIFVELTPSSNPAGNIFVFVIDDGGSSDRIYVNLNGGTNRGEIATINSGGNTGVSSSSSTYTAGTALKLIGAYEQDYVIAGLNGGLDASPDTTADLPPTDTLTTARIGLSHAGGSLNGTIGRIEYWPYRIINPTLQELTS